MPSDPHSSRSGFTLLEMLVALLVFVLIFGPLADNFQAGFRLSFEAKSMIGATLFAQSELASVGIELPLQEGTFEGEAEDGLHWRTTIRLAAPSTNDAGLALYLVEVTVLSGPQGRAQDVKLTTLRIGRPAQ